MNHNDRPLLTSLETILGKANVASMVPMAKYTSFKIGGPAKLLLTPTSTAALIEALRLLNKEQEPFILLGNGSNVLISDEGLDSVVVLTSSVKEISVQGEHITASCGVLLSELANVAAKNSLAGLAFASGIPGSLGGAVFMNAGAYGGEMAHVIESVTYLDETGEVKTLSAEQCAFGYRDSVFKHAKGATVLEVTLRLQQGCEADIRSEMRELNMRRKEKQPLNFPSAGSTFKRPEGHFAGALIEASGLKGCQIGGAMVSEKHAGFVINAGGATCKDVCDLVRHVRSVVFEKHGVLMEPEILLLPGGWSF